MLLCLVQTMRFIHSFKYKIVYWNTITMKESIIAYYFQKRKEKSKRDIYFEIKSMFLKSKHLISKHIVRLNKVALMLVAFLFYTTPNFSEVRILDVNEENFSRIYLTDYTSVFEDTNFLKIEDVSKPEFESNFKIVKSSKEGFNFSFSSSAFWLRVEVKNSSKERLDRMLEISYPRLESISFYRQIQNDFKLTESGYKTKLATREHKSRFFVFPVSLEPNSSEVWYLRITSPNPKSPNLFAKGEKVRHK